MNNEIKLDKKATDYLKDKLCGGGGNALYRNEITVDFHKGFSESGFSFIIYSTTNINDNDATYSSLVSLLFQNTIRDNFIKFTDSISGYYDGSIITLKQVQEMSLGSDIDNTTDYTISIDFTINDQNVKTGISEVYDVTNDVSISQTNWTSCEVSIESYLV